MKNVKWVAVMTVLLFFLSGCSKQDEQSSSIPQTTAAVTTTTMAPQKQVPVEVSEKTVRLLGRNVIEQSTGRAYYDWTCSGIEFEFIGTGVSAKLGTMPVYAMMEKKRPHIVAFVDGSEAPSANFTLSQETDEYILAQGLPEGRHTMRVLKASAISYSGPFYADTLTITGSEPSVSPSQAKSRHIEFIGDSITCGYGIDAPSASGDYNSAEEYGTLAYAYLTAEALDADANILSNSGNGVYCDLNGRQVNLMPDYYPYVNFKLQTDLGIQEKSVWDNGSFPADVVVVHLGTNDANAVLNVSVPIGNRTPDFSTRVQEFRDAYVDFVKTIREKNPSAKIFCVLGGMPCNLFSEVQTAVSSYKDETGDKDIYTYEFQTSMYSVTNGIRAGHPSRQVHSLMQKELTGQIRQVMNW
mgnify:CR=1 FL=1